MSPIRIGIIGLADGSWAAKAHLPYLQSSTSKFEIVAVCNSSVQSAVKSVKDLNLPPGTRTYGNVQDIANDKDIDLVVCTTRADRHFPSILPSLKAGKSVFVEWPLGCSYEEARELLRVAEENRVKFTAVGLQGRFEATVETLHKLLAEGRIGKVLSSTITGQGLIGGPTEIQKQSYVIDSESGGSLLTIPAVHLLDTVWQVLGEFGSFQSVLSNQRPVIDLVGENGSIVEWGVKKTTPDHIMIHGRLESGAVLSVSMRGGMPFKGLPGLEWSIYGEKGEIRVTGPNAFVEIFGTTKIELHDFTTDQVEQIELMKGTFAEMEPISRNLARVYEAIAVGDKRVLCNFEQAVRRHGFVEEVYKQNLGV
ncbi:hypothetical protein ASPBRDRAFT_191301 [Aspergillus brasiliensis CBS 101740]|uniref:Gfo/Idh/MocA-like oxidoreductase N-terminal domain-containing protein n=1 Tax=Aspergillus brasiliensis (strain CBS 101740 / IMI 381727 / IBT 21946) TaxID=767769 RepID=A0A1L9V299_ASPBC|nr:hypothetical protein ASPBRDRAFT_191301 [Aspergillus brasiliensis CBS 101740]